MLLRRQQFLRVDETVSQGTNMKCEALGDRTMLKSFGHRGVDGAFIVIA